MSLSEPTISRRQGLLLAIAVAALVALPYLGDETEWGSHEERHAEIAREMTVDGDWLVPHLLGQVYHDKPPVLHWLAGLGYEAAGQPTMGLARLPSAIAGILGVAAVYGAALCLSTPRAALWAALALAVTPAYAKMARTARPDMLACAALTAACFAAAWLATHGLRRPRAALAMAALFGASCGASILAKGPIGALPILFLGFAGGVRAPTAAGLLRAAIACAALLAVVAAWVVPLWRRPDGFDYLLGVLSQHDLQSGVDQHARPFYYYLGPFPAGFAPWIVFLVVGAWDEIRARAHTAGDTPASPPSPALLMALALLCIFSAVPGKRWHYLLPVYPFAALVVGATIDRRWAQHKLWRVAPPALVAALALGVPAFYAILPALQEAPLTARFFEPNIYRQFALYVGEHVPPDARIMAFGGDGEGISFVCRRPVTGFYEEDKAALWLTERPDAYVATTRWRIQFLERSLGAKLVVVHEGATVYPDGRPVGPEEARLLCRAPGWTPRGEGGSR